MRHALAATSLVFAASTAFAAGMYDQPYAVVERGDNSEVRKEAQVAITKVDGKGTRDPRRTDPIPPGKHVVTVHFTSARGVFRPEYQDVEIDMAACTRYRIVAQYEGRTGGDWKPVYTSEPIGECRRKFASAAPKK
ncbi:MAG TPA: hypothetical protein VNB03_04415 [Casimicrobiaceae bacterium]|nr:hypothetical protein [Casimicrobiaceae bacterium]